VARSAAGQVARRVARRRVGAHDLARTIARGFVELDAERVSSDPLLWPGYREQRRRAEERAGARESVVCGFGWIGSTLAVIVAFDFRYLGGSIGEATGDKIVGAFEHALEARLPVVTLVASGGSRLQEGMRSLVQMQRIAAVAGRLRAAGVPHVGVAQDPTTGGAWAALAAGADVLLATPGGTVAFAGQRVRVDGVDVAFTAEGKLADGQIDRIVSERQLPRELAQVLELLRPAPSAPPAPADVPQALGRTDLPADGWSAVQRARADERPRAERYLDAYFDTRVPLSGDRVGGIDRGMLCGIGRRGGRTIAYAAQTGTANTAAGFRTATRVVQLANRLRLPILTLIDTPGAANDAEAEHAGIGASLAELFGAIAASSVPVTSLVIGEGGSGGALALASRDELWMTPDAYFSVTHPEAAAAILKLHPADVPDLAERLHLRPQDLVLFVLGRVL
jgi:acetyl-CoA carboxylase carboxyl transferase subunit beta